jgi:hypothetical protein
MRHAGSVRCVHETIRGTVADLGSDDGNSELELADAEDARKRFSNLELKTQIRQRLHQ